MIVFLVPAVLSFGRKSTRACSFNLETSLPEASRDRNMKCSLRCQHNAELLYLISQLGNSANLSVVWLPCFHALVCSFLNRCWTQPRVSVTACCIFAMPASVRTILGMTVAHHRKNFLSASNSLCTTLLARANVVLAMCFKEKCSGEDPGTLF